MRVCSSCGKANNPTRKYCVRCGNSLLSSKIDEARKISTSTSKQPKIIEKVEPEVRPETPSIPVSEMPRVTTNDQWVKPSEVQSGRIRTGSVSRGKSEMEKAREAFAKAEKVGIQDETGDIVETRMLRASEVREFMQEMKTQPQVHEEPVARVQVQPTQSNDVAVTEQPVSPPVKPTSIEKAAIAPQQPIPTKAPTITKPIKTAPPGLSKSGDATSQTSSGPALGLQHAAPPTAINSGTSMESSIAPSASIVSGTRIKEMDAIRSMITEPDDLKDSKIKDYITELTNLHNELHQLTANQVAISTQFDNKVRESHNKAEVKRIHYESISEQLRLAKQEWDDAKGEYEKAESRRKRELSTIDDRIKNIQKRIEKAEGGVKKRIGELDKVREKIAQLQKQET